MSKIVNFHLPATDVARAATFYREIFGWEFVQAPGTDVPYLIHDVEGEGGAGIPAAIVARQDVVKHPVPTVDVTGIDQVMVDIATKGGQQGSVQHIPGIGRFGYAIDSEGNVIALLEREVSGAS